MEHHSSLIFGLYIYLSKAQGKINQLLDRSLKLDLVKVGKNATLFNQFIMAAFFSNAILCDNDNSVGTSDRSTARRGLLEPERVRRAALLLNIP